ncbi:hypothetical protein LJ737_08105 [Hymenobacter sp. 15J16-1T3B]|uniref:hypothetical protein n=1 Tax=Hymenobacter sp. 15J16-1T3B TaxID=2886941 RepID=UPI001D111877|nr:hypothetical protein [Hymenobacter sp. 15J16-1T3B]MCC3157197.1 hypothetical protein [Hymenobacter sp. 15J16-1T3B]
MRIPLDFPAAHRPWLRRSLGLLSGVGVLVLLFRTIDDFPESLQRTLFFLGLLLANVLVYLLVTRRGGSTPGAGQAAQTLLVAAGVLLHMLSVCALLLACLFIALDVNPH